MRRNVRLIQFIGSFLLLWMSAQLPAVEIAGLYDAQVEVVDRASQTFRGATQDALAEVIVRVSGDSRAIESPDIVAALSKPDRYLLQFGYEKLPPRESRLTGAGTGSLFSETLLLGSNEEFEALPELLLKLQFDERAINQLLRRAGLPIWASSRPEVLLWLGAEQNGQRQLVSPSSTINLSDALLKEGERRGLPLSMPIYDLQDQAVVSIGDIWGLFTDRLIEASNRYPSTGILMAKVYQNNDGQWQGSWVLHVEGRSEWFDSQGANADDAIAQAIDWAADQMAARFAILASGDDSDAVELQITGIDQLRSYAQVSEYLDGLVAIRRVEMKAIQGGKLTFQVYLESDKEQFQQALRLDDRLGFLGESLKEQGGIEQPSTVNALHQSKLDDQDDTVVVDQIDSEESIEGQPIPGPYEGAEEQSSEEVVQAELQSGEEFGLQPGVLPGEQANRLSVKLTHKPKLPVLVYRWNG